VLAAAGCYSSAGLAGRHLLLTCSTACPLQQPYLQGSHACNLPEAHCHACNAAYVWPTPCMLAHRQMFSSGPVSCRAGAEGAVAGEAGHGQAPCGICSAAHILSPWAARPCGHQFCYYCLRSHCLADPGYTCPICLAKVEAMQRCMSLAAT
jgi:hypothetical protein